MVYTPIPDADLDGGSGLKTGVLTLLAGNPVRVAAGLPDVGMALRIGLEAAYFENKPAGYIRPDGLPSVSGDCRCVVSPVEVSDIFIFDESISWTPPVGVRQMLIEVWGAGSSGYNGFGSAGGYCLKLLDVVSGPVDITIGLGGDPSGSTVVAGGSTTVRYGAFAIQAAGGGLGIAGTSVGGDVNMSSGGAGLPPRGGGHDSSGNGLAGACGAGTTNLNSPGGNGRVTVKVIG